MEPLRRAIVVRVESHETARPGDVLLVAYMKHARWVSSLIQRISGSWYSHAMVALGEGRYAEARPARGANIVIHESEDALSAILHDDTLYDLYRAETPPDPERLWSVVEDYRTRAVEPATTRTTKCGTLSKSPGVIFSDGNLLALLVLRAIQQAEWPLAFARVRRARDAILVTAEDGEGRMLCSGFVHGVLDGAGARPAAPPPDETFINLRDFPTDEPVTLGGSTIFEWVLDKVTAGLDFDWRSIQTCKDVLHLWKCHFDRGTPVPDPLHVANFVTPGDLARSPSLQKVATRQRLLNGEDSGWGPPLRLKDFGTAQ